MSGFDAYPGNSGKGSIEGYIENVPYISVHCHGKSSELFDKWNDCSDNWLMTGKIVNAFAQNDYDDAIVVKELQVVNKNYKEGESLFKQMEDKKEEIPFIPGSSNDVIAEKVIYLKEFLKMEKGETKAVEGDYLIAADYAIPKNFYGPQGVEVSREKWHELIKEGCVHCQGPIYDYENHRTSWSDDRKPVCPDCVKLLNYGAFH